MKKCPKCNETKDLDSFGFDKKKKDGKFGICKACLYLIQHEFNQTPKGRYIMIRKSAKKRGYGFSLTMDEFMAFWNKPCFYCEDPINGIGLDRINNSEGYEIKNVVPCCQTCNLMKLVASSEDFINQCRKISEAHDHELS